MAAINWEAMIAYNLIEIVQFFIDSNNVVFVDDFATEMTDIQIYYKWTLESLNGELVFMCKNFNT